jgi:hypothetical protein
MKPTTLMVSVVLTVSRWQAPVHSLEATGALSFYLASQREQTAMTLSPLPRWEALRVGSRSSASSASGPPEQDRKVAGRRAQPNTYVLSAPFARHCAWTGSGVQGKQ